MRQVLRCVDVCDDAELGLVRTLGCSRRPIPTFQTLCPGCIWTWQLGEFIDIHDAALIRRSILCSSSILQILSLPLLQLVWTRYLQFLAAFRQTGPFVKILAKMVQDMVPPLLKPYFSKFSWMAG